MNPPPHMPQHYPSAIRGLIRYSIVMAFVGLVSGILFQESSKKMDYAAAPPGLHIEATIRLALLHGHVIVTAVLLPLTMAFALIVARRIGGRPVGPRPVLFLTRGYLSFITVSLGLMLYKGYHILLGVRGGNADLDAVLDDLFGGVSAIRHSIYAVAHIGMAICLGVFLVALWRSLPRGTTGGGRGGDQPTDVTEPLTGA